jgi:hypothetical protein
MKRRTARLRVIAIIVSIICLNWHAAGQLPDTNRHAADVH